MIPFSPPHITEEAINEVVDTLRSGWITTGPKTKLFEKKIAEYCKIEDVLCVSSCAFGLELILNWFGVGSGDEVIVPAYTYCASANVVLHTGAKLVLVDIQTDGFNIDINKIAKHITNKTKVIMPVDIGGIPADYKSLYELVNSPSVKTKFNPNSSIQTQLGRILILTDAAHSLGAQIGKTKTGALSDISVFSFHAVKNLTTAEGGAIALNLPEIFSTKDVYEKLNTLSLHGQSKDALAKTKKGSWDYDVVDFGYKGNMTDIQASLGLIALKHYDKITLLRRKEIFEIYDSVFCKWDWAVLPLIHLEKTITPSFHLYMLRVKGIDENQRNSIIQEIFDNNISVNVHYKPLPMLTAYQQIGCSINNYPNSYEAYKNEITLPVFTTLTNEQAFFVSETIVNIVNSNK